MNAATQSNDTALLTWRWEGFDHLTTRELHSAMQLRQDVQALVPGAQRRQRCGIQEAAVFRLRGLMQQRWRAAAQRDEGDTQLIHARQMGLGGQA
jgi:hypothetical protein